MPKQPEQHLEVERTYDVDDETLLPELLEVEGVERVTPPQVLPLEAVYHDTADLALARARVTLRRRRGGHDDGWTLKLPDAAGRLERTAPLGRSTRPPAALLEPVRALVRDHPLGPVTTISTRRTLRTLLDAEGRTLAEVCDDVVTTTGPRGDQAWREWEVELGPHGDTALLDAVEVLLLAAGAQVSDTPSKQARALGRLPKRLRAVPALPGRGSSTGELVQAFVRTQTATLVTADPALRSGDLAQRTAAVHEARLSVRRLRSTLTAYAALLDPAATQPLAEELRWFGRLLGEARDAHVTGERLLTAVRELPPELVLGPVAARVDTHFAGAEQRAARAVTAALGGRRYYRLLDALDALAADPPLTEAAQAPAAKGLEQVLRHEWKRLDRRARAALAGPGEAADGTSADELLHATRKAAKRLRYVAESARPVVGKPAKRLAASAHHVQQLLGDHQDAAVALDALRELGVRAHLDGDNAFTYGLLHAGQQALAERSRREFADGWARLRPERP
ncbi:CYTH and CHAD domain-containing protein [Angustibacter aerolatus]